MATYKMYYDNGDGVIHNKEYVSEKNIDNVVEEFMSKNLAVTIVVRIDILADPDGINTNEALGRPKSTGE